MLMGTRTSSLERDLTVPTPHAVCAEAWGGGAASKFDQSAVPSYGPLLKVTQPFFVLK